MMGRHVWEGDVMAQEIERKFLTRNEAWRSLATGQLYRQGYIYTNVDRQVCLNTHELVFTAPNQHMTTPIPPAMALEILAILAAAPLETHPAPLPLHSDRFTLRPRIVGDRGIFTIKTRTVGISRSEFEFEIPLDIANQLLDQVCDRPLIEKYRYKIPYAGLIWEVDEFLGENQGLILAEVELTSEDQTFDRPDWIGLEVSGDGRYFNSYLAKHPFTRWPD
jgi:adenylate cyclase